MPLGNVLETLWKPLGVKTMLLKKSRRTQPAFICSKLTIETLEQGVKYVQS